jgi:hypothetical protein
MLSTVSNHHPRIFCAILLSLSSAVFAGGQAVPSGALSAELRAKLRDERFGIVTSIRGLPLGVRSALQTLFGSQTLDIAEPGARFQAGERSVSTLPTRRLVAAGCSHDYCLVYYERGGVRPTSHVALFRWTPEATKFEWGGAAPAGLMTIEDVRTAILSGAIKPSPGPW